MNNMGDKFSRTYARMKELKVNDENISKISEKEKLTLEEKRKRFIAKHSPREKYRNYSGKQYSFSSVVYQVTLTNIFAVLFFGLYIIAAILGVTTLIFFVSPFVGTISAIFLGGIVLYSPLRKVIRRASFKKKLQKLCRQNKLNLRCYNSFFKSLIRPTGKVDFTVESRDTLWEVMFFPAPKKLSNITFGSPEHATIATRILKNRFTEALGLDVKVRTVDYRFEGNANSKKVLLLSPVPYSLHYYDKKENKVIPGDTGVEFFGYSAYSGSGFLNMLCRL